MEGRGQMWWHTPIIPALWRLGHVVFKTILGYIGAGGQPEYIKTAFKNKLEKKKRSGPTR